MSQHTNTTGHEDWVLSRTALTITEEINCVVKIVSRLDNVIDQKNREIETLKEKVMDLEGEIEELKSQVSSMNDEIKSHGG